MKKMEKICIAILVATIIILPTALLPARPAFAQTQAFDKFQLKGPMVDGIDISIYNTVEAEALALQKGDIDMIDWPLPAEQIPAIQGNSKLSIMTFADYGYMYIGVNTRRAPLNDVKFRQALMYLIDRDKIVAEGLKGLGNVLPAGLIGPAYADWQNKNIPEYTFNPTKAVQLLDAAGYKLDAASGKRIDPATGKPIRSIDILARIDDPNRKLASDLLAAEAQKIGLQINSVPRERAYISAQVYVKYDYDMFTGGWILGDIPDWLYDFFSSDMLPEKHDMEPYWNGYTGFNNAQYDVLANKVKFGASIDEAKTAALQAQVILADQLPYLPLYQAVNVIAMNTADWENYVRREGRTDATVWWSTFNVHKKGVDFGGTFKLGFKSDIEKMNPFDSTWYWDWMVLGEVYDSLLVSNPLTPLNLEPWMATSRPSIENWEYAPGKSAPVLTFKLANNITWHDGAKFTSKDVKFTIEYLRDKQSAYWFSYVMNVAKVDTPDDYTVKVYTNQTSPWWEIWIGGLYILPQHVWSSVSDPSTYEAWREGKMIGTGPFKLTEYKPGEYVRLAAYPGYFKAPAGKPLALEKVQATQGDMVTLDTPAVAVAGKAVDNATFKVTVRNQTGAVVQTVTGTHKGGGVYSAGVDTKNLSPGTYTIEGDISYQIGGAPGFLAVTKQLILNAPFPTLLVGGVVVLVIIVAAGFVAMRRRREGVAPVKK